MDENLMNGEVFAAAKKNIDKSLKKKTLNPDTRVLLESHRLLIIFMSQDHPLIKKMYESYEEHLGDHEKVSQMYPVYKYARWLWITILGILLVGYFSGHLGITLTFK